MIVRINGKVLESGVIQVQEFSPRLVDRINSSLVLYSGGAGLLPLITAYMGISKYLTVGVIMFAGTAWMFGHRSKAIELLIGAGAGFLLVLNSWELVNFLEHLK